MDVEALRADYVSTMVILMIDYYHPQISITATSTLFYEHLEIAIQSVVVFNLHQLYYYHKTLTKFLKICSSSLFEISLISLIEAYSLLYLSYGFSKHPQN